MPAGPDPADRHENPVREVLREQPGVADTAGLTSAGDEPGPEQRPKAQDCGRDSHRAGHEHAEAEPATSPTIAGRTRDAAPCRARARRRRRQVLGEQPADHTDPQRQPCQPEPAPPGGATRTWTHNDEEQGSHQAGTADPVSSIGHRAGARGGDRTVGTHGRGQRVSFRCRAAPPAVEEVARVLKDVRGGDERLSSGGDPRQRGPISGRMRQRHGVPARRRSHAVAELIRHHPPRPHIGDRVRWVDRTYPAPPDQRRPPEPDNHARPGQQSPKPARRHRPGGSMRLGGRHGLRPVPHKVSMTLNAARREPAQRSSGSAGRAAVTPPAP